MLPATGILLTERLYLRLELVSISDESVSEYANLENGEIQLRVLDGRDKKFVVKVGRKTISGADRNTILTFGGLDGGTDTDYSGDFASVEVNGYDYDFRITDLAYNITFSGMVHIGYAGSGSFLRFDGVNYSTAGDIIEFNSLT